MYHCNHKGFSTIELLLAFSIGISFLCAAMMLVFNDQSVRQRISLESGHAVTLDTISDNTGLQKTMSELEASRAVLKSSWHYTFASTSHAEAGLTVAPLVAADISPCLKEITTKTNWGVSPLRPRSLSVTTLVNNLEAMKALGGDCNAFPSNLVWTNPHILSSYTTSTATFGALDVFDQTAYVAGTSGQLHILDTVTGAPHLTGIFVTGAPLNDIDVADWVNPASGSRRRFAYTVRHDVTAQLQIIDVTNPSAPTSLSTMTKTFAGANPPQGSFPQGWRAMFYDNKLYALTRETAGYEFHIFNVTDPTYPQEIGPGLEINGTANDMAIVDVRIATTEHHLVFLATERSAQEIMILNVTNPIAPVVLTTIDLPTNLDALCLTVLGNKLYVGRQRYTGGPELTAFALTYSTTTPLQITVTPIGSGANIDGNITSMRATAEHLFITTSLGGDSFQVWNVSSPETGITRSNINPFGATNRITGEIDYSHPYIYASSQFPQALRILNGAP